MVIRGISNKLQEKWKDIKLFAKWYVVIIFFITNHLK